MTVSHPEMVLDAGSRDIEPPRVLVAGVGNIFLGDDGFGVEVVARLADRPMPAGVKVADFGIRGLHLAYELLDGYDVLVLVDALPLGEPAGTLALVEAELPTPDAPAGAGAGAGDDVGAAAPVIDAHSMSPAIVLGSLAHLGGSIDRVLVVGCQPATVDDGIGLSDPVAAAVDDAMAMVHEVLDGLLAGARDGSPIEPEPDPLEPRPPDPRPVLRAPATTPARTTTTTTTIGARMMRRLVFPLLAAGAVAVAYTAWPDIQRYLKIKQM